MKGKSDDGESRRRNERYKRAGHEEIAMQSPTELPGKTDGNPMNSSVVSYS